MAFVRTSNQRYHANLYWADKLGVLVMADLPNSWGDPDAKMQQEAENTFRDMVKRDFNHPAIFSWILFNETWGLRTHVEEDGKRVGNYLPETQMWVASMYYLAKSLTQRAWPKIIPFVVEQVIPKPISTLFTITCRDGNGKII